MSKKKAIIKKSNAFIDARYKLSITESRIFLSALSQIRKGDTDFIEYTVKVKEIAKLTGSKDKDIYNVVRHGVRKLLKRLVLIPNNENSGFYEMGLVRLANYNLKDGSVGISFNPELKPYLLGLKKNYTLYEYEEIMKLPSIHSQRMYEIIKRYEYRGKVNIEVEELKKIFMVEKSYSRYNDFKKRVILKAQEDIHKYISSISFRFREIKKGRKVKSIEFIICSSNDKQLEENTYDDLPSIKSELAKSLKMHKFSKNEALDIVKNKSEKVIKAAIAIYEENRDTVKNARAYILKLIDEEVVYKTDEDIERDRQKAERIRLEKETQKRENMILELEQEWEKYCWGETQKIINDIPRERMLKFIDKSKPMPFIMEILRKRKVIDINGKIDENICRQEPLFISFIKEKHFPKETEFIKWAKENKRVDIQKKGDDYIITKEI